MNYGGKKLFLIFKLQKNSGQDLVIRHKKGRKSQGCLRILVIALTEKKLEGWIMNIVIWKKPAWDKS